MNDLRRPLPLLLLAIAIVGWIVAIWALSSKSSMERDFRAELAGIETARDQLSADLQAHREAAGKLGELKSALTLRPLAITAVQEESDDEREGAR